AGLRRPILLRAGAREVTFPARQSSRIPATGRSMRITRRRLASELAASAALARAAAAQSASAPAGGPGHNEPPTGNLYTFIQHQADTGPALSFRRPEFRSLANWQKRARARLFDRLSYTAAPVKPEAELIRRTDRGDYTVESIRLRTS